MDLASQLRERTATAAPIAGSQLHALMSRHGAHNARRLAAAARVRRQLRQRFPVRAVRGEPSPDVGLSRVWILDLATADAGIAARDLAADPAVEYAEPDRELSVALMPDDSFLRTSGSWGQAFADLWGLFSIRAPQAWDVATGAGIVVAVIDTGVDHTHPDLAPNLWTNAAEIAANDLDDDGNGYVDDILGYDFADSDASPLDDHMHGTHVAGTIAAVAGNGRGVAGVAFDARIMAVRGLGSDGSGATSQLARSIVYAVDNGADVINASWSGSGLSQLLGDAVAYAHAAGVVFVAAAGNAGRDTASFTPAAEPGAIAVAAFNSQDVAASFSNYGVKLDVGAPGGGDVPPPSLGQTPVYSILSLLSAFGDLARYGNHLGVGSGYARLAGTSMAAPHVSGAAALILQLHPSYTVEQVRQVLRTSSRDVGPAGADAASGYGLLDASAALAAPEPLVAHIESPRAGELEDTAATIEIRGSAYGAGFESYTLELGASAETQWTAIVADQATPVVAGTLGVLDASNLLDGSYVLRLTVRRGADVYVDRVAVTVGSAELTSPRPAEAVRASGTLSIVGTAAGAGFSSYVVDWRRPAVDPDVWSTAGIVRTSPTSPVRGGVLATFDMSAISESDRYDFRLRVFNANGVVERTRQGIALDPALRSGWPQQIQPVADHQYLTVADLDADGRKEILVGSAREVLVFEHDGTMKTGWPQSVGGGFPSSTTTGSPVVADIDGDGASDVVATNRHQLFAWSADGQSKPGFPVLTTVYRGTTAHLAAGDLDGDGDDEILCSADTGSEAFDGDGTVVPGWSWVSGLNDSALAVGDAAGDARVEIVFYTRDDHPGTRRRTLSLRDALRLPLQGWPVRARSNFLHPRMGMADMDGDGALDVFSLAETAGFKLRASAHSATGRRMPVGSARLRDVCQASGARCDPFSNGLAAYGDVDEDGRAEAYLYAHTPAQAPIGEGFNQFLQIRADRAATAPAAIHRAFNMEMAMQSLAIGDIDGDGEQELVTGSSGYDGLGIVRKAVVAASVQGDLHPFFPRVVPIPIHGTGDAPELPVTDFAHFDDERFASPAIADLDGDGLKEVVWVDPLLMRVFVWNVPGVASPEKSDWPMYHHDPRHGNALAVP